jgi:hypothetical protein
VAARQAHNLKVAGSNPAPAIFVAEVAELADAPRSGRGARRGIWVQLPSSAPDEKKDTSSGEFAYRCTGIFRDFGINHSRMSRKAFNYDIHHDGY